MYRFPNFKRSTFKWIFSVPKMIFFCLFVPLWLSSNQLAFIIKRWPCFWILPFFKTFSCATKYFFFLGGGGKEMFDCEWCEFLYWIFRFFFIIRIRRKSQPRRRWRFQQQKPQHSIWLSYLWKQEMCLNEIWEESEEYRMIFLFEQ